MQGNITGCGEKTNKICCEGRQRYLQLVSKTEEEKADLEEGLDVERGHSGETCRNTECVGGRIVLILSFGINHTSCTTCTTIVKPDQNIYKLWDSSAVHSRTAEEEHRECSSLRPSQLSFFPWCHGPSHCTVLHTTGAMVPPPTSSSQPTKPTILYTKPTQCTQLQHPTLPITGTRKPNLGQSLQIKIAKKPRN